MLLLQIYQVLPVVHPDMVKPNASRLEITAYMVKNSSCLFGGNTVLFELFLISFIDMFFSESLRSTTLYFRS